MKRASLVLLLSFLFPGFVFSQNTWLQKANYGGGFRQWSVGFSIGNLGYIGLGSDESFNNSSSFWSYDPSLNSWTQVADFGGGPRAQAVGFSIGSKGYAGTGYSSGGNNDFWEYDPSLNQWTQKNNVPGPPRGSATGFGTSAKGYLGTGSNGGNPRQDFYEYDPVADSWTTKSDFGGGPRDAAVSFSIGDKGYLGTGHDGAGLTNDFWEFDPVNDVWTQKADVGPNLRDWAVGFSIGSRGYIGTGLGDADGFFEYDPFSNVWTQVANFPGGLGDGCSAAAAFSIGLTGYIGTGQDASSITMNQFWEYTPSITDAGITSLIPFGTICAGSIDVQVTLHNYGNVALTSTTIKWEVDTLPQSDFAWTGNILPGNDTAFIIGNFVFTSGSHTLTAYPADPNGIPDFNNANDTLISFVTVNYNPIPVILPASPVTLCQGESLTSSSATAYQWKLNGSPITGATDASYTPVSDGTYSVLAENAFNCTAESDPHTVTIAPLPLEPVSGGDQSICSSDTLPALSVTVGAGETAYWFTTATGGSPIDSLTTSYTPVSGGTFYAEAVNAAGCRSANRTPITLTIHPDTSVNITGSTLICSSDSSTFDAGAGFASYSWSTGGTTQTIVVTTAQNYTVTVTDANGCTATDSQALVVNAAAEVSAGTDQIICSGAGAQLAGSYTGGATSAIWSTSGSGTFDNAGISNAVYTPSASDTGAVITLTYTTNDPLGICPAASSSMTLGFFPYLQASVSSTAAACSQSNGTATVTPTGGGGNWTFLWDDTAAQTDSIAVNLSVGNYSVMITDANACTAVFSTTVSNSSGPNAFVDTISHVSCFGGIDGSATIAASGGTGTLTYNWTPYGGSAPTAVGLEAGPYNVAVMDAAGCLLIVSLTIQQPSQLFANAGNDAAICPGGNAGIGGTATGGTLPYSYSWNTSVGISDSTLATPYAFPSFTSLFTVTVTDIHNCTASDQVMISVNTLPDIDIGIMNPACAESPVQFTAIGTGIVNYVWSNQETGPLADSIFSSPGPATMSVTVTDGNGCVNTDDTSFQVLSLPVITITQLPAGDICAGNVVQLTASNAASFIWNNNQTGNTIDSTFTSIGNNTVWAIGTDLNSCSDTGFIVTHIISRPVVSGILPANPSSCTVADGSITIQGMNTGAAYEIYITLPGFQDTSLIQSADVNGNLVIAGLDAGTYSDLYVILTSTGCSSDTLPSISLQDVGAPSTAIVTDSTTVCAGGNIDLLLNGVANTVCEWNGPSGFFSTLTHPILVNADTSMSGIYIVTQTDTVSECTGSAAVTIHVSMPHVRILSSPNPACSGQLVQVASEDTSLSSLLWSNGFNTASFSLQLFSDSVLTLTGTDSIGCVQTDTETLEVNPVTTPTVQIFTSVTTDTICTGDPVTFTAVAADTSAGTGCQWFLNGDTIPGAVFWEYTTSTLLNGDVISVRIYSSDPCAADTMALRTITVTAPPSIGSTAFDHPSCNSSDGSITLSGFASLTTYHVAYYLNSVADTTTYTSNASGEIYIPDLTAGSYAEISVGTGSCFSAPLPSTIDLFNNIGAPAISAVDYTVCSGDSILLEATGLTDAFFYWYGPPIPLPDSTFKDTTVTGSSSNVTGTVVYPAFVSGNYCVVQDTNGCKSAPACVSVNVSPRPNVFVTPPYSAVCAGQSATLIGGGAYSYIWENGELNDTITLTNLLATQDIFVIGSNQSGCLDTATAHIQVNQGLLPDHITLDTSYIPYDGINDTLCSGLTNFSIGVDDPDGFVAYTWTILLGTDTVTSFEESPDHSFIIFSPEPAFADAHYVIHLAAASSPQCSVHLSANITVLANSTLPEPSVIWDHVISGRHTLVYLDHTADHYQWGYDDKFSWVPHSIENETFQDFQIGFALDTNSRYYWVMAYYGNCFDKIYFNGPHGRSGNSSNVYNEWSVYPNPTEGVFTLLPERKPFGNLTIDICNLAGQVVMNKRFGENEVPVAGIRIDLGDFANGVYILKASDERVAYPPFRLMKSSE